MKKITLLSVLMICFAAQINAQGYTYFTSGNNESPYYNAVMPADSGLFFGMKKNNNNSSIYWLKNNVLTELKSVSSASSSAATFPDNVGGYKQWFTFGNKALFVVSDNTPYKNTLWVSDGTSAGTDSVFSSGNYNVKFYMGGMIGNYLYFTVTSLTPFKTLLYKTDFTKAGTTLVKTINNTNLFWPYTDNGSLYLHGYVGSPSSYDVLYKFGTDTTRLLLGYMYSQARVFNGNLYYGKTAVLNKKDLSTNTISVLTNTFNFTTGQIIGMFKNKVYVVGNNTSSGAQQNLYSTDGTTASLNLLYNNSNLNRIPTTYFNFIFGSNVFYFIGMNSSNHYALFASDGTSAGTHQVNDLQGSSSSMLGSAPNMRICTDRLYFNCLNYASGSSYYNNWTLSTCDSTRGSLNPIPVAGTSPFVIQNMERFQNKLIMTGNDASSSYLTKLFAINTCDAFSPLTVGLKESDLANSILLYPNPGDGSFTVEAEEGTLEIYSITGNLNFRQSLNKGKNNIHTVLPSGIYIAAIRTVNGKINIQKIVVN